MEIKKIYISITQGRGPAGGGGTWGGINGTITDQADLITYVNGRGFLTSINSGMVTGALGYTPYNATNPAGYISSVPAQSFASLTGKPTTVAGYGITDAYPLSGNPSGFVTSNVYTANGSITAARTISLGGNQFNFGSNGFSKVSINSTNSGERPMIELLNNLGNAGSLSMTGGTFTTSGILVANSAVLSANGASNLIITTPGAQPILLGVGLAEVGRITAAGLNLGAVDVATVGVQKNSTSLTFAGSGWKTNSTAAAQPVTAYAQLRPIQGAVSPTVEFHMGYTINGGSQVDFITFNQSTGTLDVGQALNPLYVNIVYDETTPVGGGLIGTSVNGATKTNTFQQGFNNQGVFGGTANALTGRQWFLYDFVGNNYRLGVNASGDTFIGKSYLSYGLKVAATNTNAVGMSIQADGTVEVQPGLYNTSKYAFRTGNFFLQGYSLNNEFLSENSYFNGASWTRVAAGYTAGFQFYNGQIIFVVGVNGAIGNFNPAAPLKVDSTNTVAIGGSIDSTVGSYTGATMIVDATGVLIPATKLTLSGSASGQGNIVFKSGASASYDTNIILTDTTTRTMGIMCGSTPAFSSANGPFVAMRGLTYSAFANQRGLMSLAAGNPSTPIGSDGVINFLTGGDNARMAIFPSGNIQIGLNSTDVPTAILGIQSTTKGFCPPVMTTTQKNAITSPIEGLIVYDATLHKLCVRTAAAWETITSV